jgi:hypothetical protein
VPKGLSVSGRKTAASYVVAFYKHDAQAVADHWSLDAAYLNRSSGGELSVKLRFEV